MAFAVKSSRHGPWTLQEEKPSHFLSNYFNPAEDNHCSSHESNSPPFLKAVPPHTLAAVASSFSFPYTHCSFQILQTVPTFVSEISFCPQWCCRTSSRTHGAAAAQGQPLSDGTMPAHICTFSSSHLHRQWTDRQEASGKYSFWRREQERCIRKKTQLWILSPLHIFDPSECNQLFKKQFILGHFVIFPGL